MKKVYLLFAIILFLGLGLFVKNQVEAGDKGLFYYSPCDSPLEFSIGTIDTGFEVTREELIEDAITASNIWGNTQGRQLFKYVPESDFTINMVYDTRQELTSKINDLDKDLKAKQDEIDPKIEDFKSRQSEFERRVRDLNERISYWNGQGGAPKDEYEKLVAEQKALQEEAVRLNNEAESLGQEAREYNLNAQRLNETIKDYEQVLDFKPEEGLYEQVGNTRKVSIYIDVSEDEFLHTLAHEFGHALGLEHQEDPEAIMYPQTTSDLTPSQEEIDQLSYLCRRRTIAEGAFERAVLVTQALTKRIQERLN